MAYEIYWGAGSPNSWRPLLGLEVKGIEYDSKLLEFSKREHQTPAMLAMNPRGLLPILKDGDVAVYESIAILAYLDSKHPETPLFGSTAEETGSEVFSTLGTEVPAMGAGFKMRFIAPPARPSLGPPTKSGRRPISSPPTQQP